VIAFSFLALIPLTLGWRRVVYLRAAASREERNFVFLGDRASCDNFRAEYEKMEMTQRVLFTVVTEESAAPFATANPPIVRPFQQVLEDIEAQRVSVEAIVLRETARE